MARLVTNCKQQIIIKIERKVVEGKVMRSRMRMIRYCAPLVAGILDQQRGSSILNCCVYSTGQRRRKIKVNYQLNK